MATLLWGDKAYESSSSVKLALQALVAQCDPREVADLALEIRTKQGIRTTPVFLLRELCRRPEARKIVGEYLPKVVQRADEIPMFLNFYWSGLDKGSPLASQVKKGLGLAFDKFDAYHLTKYKEGEGAVSMKDALHMIRPNPRKGVKGDMRNSEVLPKEVRQSGDPTVVEPQLGTREALYWQLSKGRLDNIATRETMLSASQTTDDKRAAFHYLLQNKQMGSLALLRNLRKMQEVHVPVGLIQQALNECVPDRILPSNFLMAARTAPTFLPEIEALMAKCMAKYSKLKGTTLFVIDTSGSMDCQISHTSVLTRLDCALALAHMVSYVCEKSVFYLTGDSTVLMPELPKFGQSLPVGYGHRFQQGYQSTLRDQAGYGGIYTRKMVDQLKKAHPADSAQRLIVISDSQDCDTSKAKPSPHWPKNYIADVSSHTLGIAYDGVWTAEIAGWSPALLEYIAEYEKMKELEEQLNLF
jgi:hypothetical protein